MKTKKLLLWIYLLVISLFVFSIPVNGATSYYIEKGPEVLENVFIREQTAEEKRISEITDPVKKLEELNKQDYNEVSEWTKFNSGEYGIVTPADNQGTYNTCWSHSVANVSEISILRSGLLPQTLTKDFKLSANSIAYTTVNRDAEDDKLLNTPTDIRKEEWNTGHMIGEAAAKLTQWVAPALSTKKQDEHIGEFVEPAYYVKDIIKINPTDTQAIKRAIAEYGAVTMSYATDIKHGDFYNSNNIKDYYKGLGIPIEIGQHAITIFGWDDTISQDNFTYNKPNNPGAWLTKNSWGPHHATNGTQYISYESEIKEVYAFTYQNVDKNLNNYYYDGTVNAFNDTIESENEITVGAIFESKVASSTKDEYLESINIGLDGQDIDVKVEVYKDVICDIGNKYDKNNNPTNGIKVTEATTSKKFWTGGNWEIKLNSPVKIEPNEIFSIVVTVSSKLGNVGIEVSSETSSYNDHTYLLNENGIFKNTGINYSNVVRIKAHTKTYELASATKSNDLKDANITLKDGNYYYDGNPLKSKFPIPVVSLDGKTLEEGKDYIVTYNENIINPDLLKTKSRTSGNVEIRITGINDYKGSFNHIYTHNPILPSPTASGFIDNEHYLTFKAEEDDVYISDLRLPDGFKITGSKSDKINTNRIYTVKYTGENKFKYETLERNLKIIYPNQLDTDINDVNVNKIIEEGDFDYTGGQIRPNVKLVDSSRVLTINKDYTLEYGSNNHAGLGTVIIRGIGSYKGTYEYIFNINKTYKNYITNFTVRNNEAFANSTFGEVEFSYYEDETLSKKVTSLTEGKTYYVKPYVLDNVNYKGIREDETIKPIKFVCKNKIIRPDKINYFEKENITISDVKFKYNGFTQKPDIEIIIGDKKLIKDKDFTVKFVANDLVNAGIKKIMITGINEYKSSGTIQFEYEIEKIDNELLKFDYIDGEIVVETKFGNEYILKYYIDKACTNEISLEKAKTLETYYVKVFIPATKNYNAIKPDTILILHNYIAPTNIKDLNALIKEVEELDGKIYTVESFGSLIELKDKAKLELEKELTEEEVSKLINELIKAKTDLVIYKKINMTSLIVSIVCSITAISFIILGIVKFTKRKKHKTI